MTTPDLLDRLAAGVRAYVLIAAVVVTAALPGFFSLPPIDRDEARYVQASVQMLESGDYVQLFNQNEPRHKKPVGIHWLQAAAVSLTTGPEARQIYAYRLPSLLGMVLAGWATFGLGALLLGRGPALLGALLFSGCLIAGFEARVAKTDAVLVATTMLAVLALAQLRASLAEGQNRAARGWAIAAWIAGAVGLLVKGPAAVLVLGLGVAFLCLWEWRWAWLKALFFWPGPLLAALIVAPWAIAIGVVTDGAFYAASLGDDVGTKLHSADEGHFGYPGYHVLLLPALLFPASLGLWPAAGLLLRTFRAPRSDQSTAAYRFLVSFIVPTWVVFELIPTKLPHYVLPVYPLLALLAGAGLVQIYAAGRARLSPLLFTLIGAGIATALAVLASGLLPGDALVNQRRMVQAGLLMGSAGLIVSLVVGLARGPILAGSAALLLAFGTHNTVFGHILPEARGVLVAEAAADSLDEAGLNPRANPNAPPLIVVGFREMSLVFLTRTDTRLLTGEAAGALAQLGDVVVLNTALPLSQNAFLRGLAARGLAFRPVGLAAEGLNYANNERARLQPGRVVAVVPSQGAEGPPT